MEEGERMHGGGGGQRAKDRGCVTGRGSGGGRNYDESLLARERERMESVVSSVRMHPITRKSRSLGSYYSSGKIFLLLFWIVVWFLVFFFHRALVFLSLDDE